MTTALTITPKHGLRLLTTLMLGLALVLPAAAASANITCNIVDRGGNRLAYVFAPNTHNADGSLGGTVVEDSFSKNGKLTISPVGQRPVWTYADNGEPGLVLFSQDAPGWSIDIDVGNNGLATLAHNGRWIGSGVCVPTGVDGTKDQGIDD